MACKILIVDDDEVLLESLKRYLETFVNAKVDIRKALSGPEALEILESDKDFQLIISDFDMKAARPGETAFDGDVLFSKVREIARLRHIPFVIFSMTAPEKIKGIGFDAVIPKDEHGKLIVKIDELCLALK